MNISNSGYISQSLYNIIYERSNFACLRYADVFSMVVLRKKNYTFLFNLTLSYSETRRTNKRYANLYEDLLSFNARTYHSLSGNIFFTHNGRLYLKDEEANFNIIANLMLDTEKSSENDFKLRLQYELKNFVLVVDKSLMINEDLKRFRSKFVKEFIPYCLQIGIQIQIIQDINTELYDVVNLIPKVKNLMELSEFKTTLLKQSLLQYEQQLQIT